MGWRWGDDAQTAPCLATMAALAYWLLAKPHWKFAPHPIYFTWMVSLAVFFLVAVVDRRRVSS